MPIIVLQHTSLTIGDVMAFDDDTVTVDGNPSPSSIVSHHNGLVRVDVDGTGIIDANPSPFIAGVQVIHGDVVPGKPSFKIILTRWADDVIPSDIAIAFYGNPDGENPRSESELMAWDGDEWSADAPPGIGPGVSDIYMGLIYKGKRYSAFTMRKEWGNQTFSGGGDY